MTDHTGRDDQIVTKALAYAIVTIRNLPKEDQESSDCDDMLTILKARFPNPINLEHHLARARAHIGVDASAELEEERARAEWRAAHPGEDEYF